MPRFQPEEVRRTAIAVGLGALLGLVLRLFGRDQDEERRRDRAGGGPGGSN